ncbi:MAG: acetolactate synthase-1/2/3 large subunit [Chloroflexi bacterium]|jgi:acetolactate synthase-1/2/3 large subunit|nr:MAG: acetolactate synthase-1/2/3 large subunit [Chloroflexota bacterium]
MGKVTGSYLIARTLKEEGVEVLFYLMGGPNFDIVMACQDFGIKTVDFRHEQAAAFAAHAYARLTGKPGVCTAASGPGTLNLLTGVYTASIDCAPMIILGGAGPVHEIGRDAFQEVDQVGIFKPLCKYVHQPTLAERYPEIISTAFRQATSGRPGPVYIDCGADVLYEEVEESKVIKAPRPLTKSRPSADPKAIEVAINLISAAKKPIIFAGGGVFFSDASGEFQRFIDITKIPFYTSPMSRGLAPEDHPVSFPAARSKAMREADLVLVIGTRLNWMMQYGSRFSDKAKLIQIDIEESELGHNRDCDLGIVADAKIALTQLINAANQRSQDFDGRLESQWIQDLSEYQTEKAAKMESLLNSNQVPIHPLRLCNEINKFLDRDAIVTVDGNEILHFGRQSINTYFPGHRLNSGVTGTMGVGLPYGIGSKLAKPEKQNLVLHGDGSMGMNAMELDTLVRFNLPVVTVISNNAGWTARTPNQRKPGRELGFTPFHEMAKVLGCYGERVENPDEIRPALERAFSSGKPAVIDVIVEPTAAARSAAWGGSRME